MAKLAPMGISTVCSCVLEVCRRNEATIARGAGEPLKVQYILDVRDFSYSPDAALFTKSIDTMLNDPEIEGVVETIGGPKFACPYVRRTPRPLPCWGCRRCACSRDTDAPTGRQILSRQWS